MRHFLICGLGAMTPALCQILLVDAKELTFVDRSFLLGVVLRAVLYFVIGGTAIHYIYVDERHPGKLFYAGLAAPAMFLALANGQKIELPPAINAPTVQQSSANSAPAGLLLTWTVYAAAGPQLKTFGPPTTGFAGQVIQGILGNVPHNVYFAIAGSYPTAAWARARMPDVQARFPRAEIYGPSAGNSYYSIVIGAQITLPDAQARVRDALVHDLPEAYTWRLGDTGVLPNAEAIANQLGSSKNAALRNAARDSLIQCGADCFATLRGILSDPASNQVRERDLLLAGVQQVVAGLEQRKIACPPDIAQTLAKIEAEQRPAPKQARLQR